MKTKNAFFLIFFLIYSCYGIYAQNFGNELLTHNNFGTTTDGVTGINRVGAGSTLYPALTGNTGTVNAIKNNYYQPPTRAFYNWGATQISNVSINPTVTIAPPLPASQTSYIFGFNETWFSSYFTFATDPNAATPVNSNIQIPMAPNNGYYVIATSTQGMYNAPTLAANSAAWDIVYDRYEVNTVSPSNYFMIVNADADPTKVFYKQKVSVKPGHIYRMYADVARLNTGGTNPDVAFIIIPSSGNDATDETTLKSINTTSAPSPSTGLMLKTGAMQNVGIWNTYSFDYVAPCTATPASEEDIWVAFSNAVSGGNGNDLALDNLSLKEILPQITTTVLEPSNGSSGECAKINLNAIIEIDSQAQSSYSVAWYKTTNPDAPNIANDEILRASRPLSSSTDTLIVPGAGDYYYTLSTTATAGCPVYSPVITIAGPSDICAKENIIEANYDLIQVNPGATVTHNIITGIGTDNLPNGLIQGADCNSDTASTHNCQQANLQIVSFTIPSIEGGAGDYGPSGTFTPGTPIVITKTSTGQTIGLLTVQSDGTVTFQEAPDYKVATNGESISFDYTIVNSQNGATSSAASYIFLADLAYDVAASCVGYPIRVIFKATPYTSNFRFNDGMPYPAPYDTLESGKGPHTTIDFSPAYPKNINDVLATRYYLVNANTKAEISDRTILDSITANGFSDIKIYAARTDTSADGGEVIFEFKAHTPGLLCFELHKKEPYAIPNPQTDPIRSKFVVQVCPGTASWNGAVSNVWKENSNWYSEGLGSYPIWCTDVTIPGPVRTITDTTNTKKDVVLGNFPIIKEGDACRDIVFESGASVGLIQNLTYRAAFVQYQPPMITDTANYTNKWTMITVPLKYVYSADFQPDPSWGASAFTNIKSYMSYFDVAYSQNNAANPDGIPGTSFGSFSRPFANLKEKLTAGFGFASNVVLSGSDTTFVGSTGNSSFYFPRYVPYGNAQPFDNGQDSTSAPNEVNFSYHWKDNGEWITDATAPADSLKPFTLGRGTPIQKTRNSTWDTYFYSDSAIVQYTYPSKSQFNLTDSSSVNYFSPFQKNPLAGEDSRFRFIYEDAAYNYVKDAGTFTVKLSGTGNTRIVGNPLMSHLDFDKFSKENAANASSIQPYYRIWDGTVFHTYGTPNADAWRDIDTLSTGTNQSATKYIPPMQAFFVDVTNKLANGADLSLNFDTTMSTAVPSTSVDTVNIRLRAKGVGNENLLRLRLKMKGVETVALLASLPGATDSYNANEDVYKLFSYNSVTPEIYTVSDKTAIEINAVSQEGEQKLIPLGVKTSQTGQLEISVEGAGNFTAYQYVRLRDALENTDYDLKNQTAFTFSKTAAENLEGRFYILLSNMEGGIETTIENPAGNEDGAISIIRENDAVRVYSPLVAIDGFEVYDVSGRILFKDVNIKGYSYLWNPGLEQGVYLIRVNAGKESKVQKIKW
ncbi:MAG: T9SS type A sorting domain-containing protein [Prevotellaceae bacterium]|nr:T9SS type A sorting domain-containing protein [Prevotellaceae bacterium]